MWHLNVLQKSSSPILTLKSGVFVVDGIDDGVDDGVNKGVNVESSLKTF